MKPKIEAAVDRRVLASNIVSKAIGAVPELTVQDALEVWLGQLIVTAISADIPLENLEENVRVAYAHYSSNPAYINSASIN